MSLFESPLHPSPAYLCFSIHTHIPLRHRVTFLTGITFKDRLFINPVSNQSPYTPKVQADLSSHNRVV